MNCPVLLCTGTARPGRLMCSDCWSRVPRNLRADVNRAWSDYRLWMGTTPRYSERRTAARGAYIAARNGAIDAAERSRP